MFEGGSVALWINQVRYPMNIYGIIILATLGIDFILNLVADSLNLKNLKNELPAEFRDWYKSEDYTRSQEYTRTRTYFGFILASFELVVILLFWFLGGFNELDKIVRGWDLPAVWRGLIYIGILMLGRAILLLPFHAFSTFVIEEKFGFNKTKPVIFITDLLKLFALVILLGGPLLACVLAFFQYAGAWAWFYCWMITVLFTLFVQFIAPTWILPLFSKFKPLEEGELKDKIMTFTQKVTFPVKEIFITDGSKRSSKSNAFFTGFGQNKRIALFDTLVERHNNLELVTILAHEIGHYKKKHILKGMAIGIIHTGVLFYLLSIFISHQGLFEAFYMDHMSIYAGLIFFGLLYSPIELILSILQNLLSRKHEYEADRFAVQTTDHPEHFIDSLKKLSLNNLSNLTPHPFFVFINYSHPTVLQRIGRIRNLSDLQDG